jgi:hypothetical protein
MKANKTMKGQAIPNHRRKGKKVESNIDSGTQSNPSRTKTTKWQESPHNYQYKH